MSLQLHCTFGMQIQSRSYTAPDFSYRYGFNGKESDDEVSGSGNQYDYGFRIYNPRIGRFLSVDPLFRSYGWLSTYQYASNIPIAAVDLDGLESRIVMMCQNDDGSVELDIATDYTLKSDVILTSDGQGVAPVVQSKESNYGPLGDGDYMILRHSDGTFSEYWVPAEGNPVDAFEGHGLSQGRWIGHHDDVKEMMRDRLNARLVESMAEDMLYQQELSKLPITASESDKQSLYIRIRMDVSVLETDLDNLKGKFAHFEPWANIPQYTEGWVQQPAYDDGHRSTQTFQGPEFYDSGIGLKYYDGARSLTDNTPSQIGLVETGWFAHRAEALDVIIAEEVFGMETNIGVANAHEVKDYQEGMNK